MIEIETPSSPLADSIKEVFEACSLHMTDFEVEPESQKYKACRFRVNGAVVIGRDAKVTPKKVGQFVTFWKRNEKGIIVPFFETDPIDYYTVNVRTENRFGQFVFPKAVLIKRGIVSTEQKEGKRAFRVYPPWDVVHSKQAEQSQKWQLQYFSDLDPATDRTRAKKLYTNHL
ncbi:MepB family protein [Rufibacter sp. DG15C]|uniref:MepB family protein n=1 Tax=Rufibacter sp. DG15C TaxID=1379909 RepID=UPI00078EA5F0|nr:MepB family protein [Rufibacter sp. DG15C]AMM50863.1 MepB family protein [Rufibacter sp. DG15C]